MKLKATVAFLAHEAGGHSKPILPGIKPQFKVGEFFTSSIIVPVAEVTEFERDVSYAVVIELPFGGHYAQQIGAGLKIQLNDGNRTIGTGIVDEVIEP